MWKGRGQGDGAGGWGKTSNLEVMSSCSRGEGGGGVITNLIIEGAAPMLGYSRVSTAVTDECMPNRISQQLYAIPAMTVRCQGKGVGQHTAAVLSCCAVLCRITYFLVVKS